MSGNLLRGVGVGEQVIHGDGGAAAQQGEAVAEAAVLSWKSCAGAWVACVAVVPDDGWEARRGLARHEGGTLELQERHCDLGRGP